MADTFIYNSSSEWISLDTADLSGLEYLSSAYGYYEEARREKRFMLDNLKIRSMNHHNYSNTKPPLYWQDWRSRR
jgi:hypothetical protein